MHRYFPSNNSEIVVVNKERRSLKKYWNQIEMEHDKLLLSKTISIEKYLAVKGTNEINRVIAFKEISKKRKSLVQEFSFNGRSSLNFWLWTFGSFITLLICSCFLAIKDARLKRAGLLKWYEPPAAISFIAVSLFWLFHTIFRKTRDFEISTYLLYVILIIIPLSYFLYHFLRRFINMEVKLLENIRDLVGFVLSNTKKEKEEEMWNVLEKVSKNGK